MKSNPLLFYRFINLVSFIAIFSTTLLAQAPDTSWTSLFGGTDIDVAYDIEQTTGGDYIVAGKTVSFGSGATDVWLLKVNSNGDTLWTRTFGGDRGDYGTSVQQTFDGGYIITGYTGTNASGYYDVWLIKTNEFGDTTWTRKYGGDYSDYGYDVMQLSDGGYVVVGNTSVIGGNYIDFYVIRTNSIGDTLWTQTYGGTGADYAYAIDITSDGGFIIAGDTQSFGTSQGGFYLIKTNAVGDTQWTAIYDNFEIDVCRDVKPTDDGGYILAGYTRSPGAGEYDMYLIKVNSEGDTLWTKKYGDFLDEECYSVQLMSDGGFVMSGYQESVTDEGDVLIVRTDLSGNAIWTKTVGGTSQERGRSICVTSDGGYIIAGQTESFGVSRTDIYLIKTAHDLSDIEFDSKPDIPEKFFLNQNYPNPFNPATMIKYQLPMTSDVELSIFNTLGQKVSVLVSEKQSAGRYQVEWDASAFSSGVYYYQFVAVNYREIKKMILLK